VSFTLSFHVVYDLRTSRLLGSFSNAESFCLNTCRSILYQKVTASVRAYRCALTFVASTFELGQWRMMDSKTLSRTFLSSLDRFPFPSATAQKKLWVNYTMTLTTGGENVYHEAIDMLSGRKGSHAIQWCNQI
jgi:hypothetical protein